MNDSTKNPTSTTGGDDAPALPAVVDRAAWQAEVDALLARERRTPTKATPSPRPGGGCRWSRSTPRSP
jgi:hypothetical protein